MGGQAGKGGLSKKKKYFAWGGTVINAVTLHTYSCTFSVGHRELLNEGKLWFRASRSHPTVAPHRVFDNVDGNKSWQLSLIVVFFLYQLKTSLTISSLIQDNFIIFRGRSAPADNTDLGARFTPGCLTRSLVSNLSAAPTALCQIWPSGAQRHDSASAWACAHGLLARFVLHESTLVGGRL